MEVPAKWTSRVLYLDFAGEGFLLQVANFDLGSQSGFESPEELPPGEVDPIVAMSGDDLLLTFRPDAPGTSPLKVPVLTRDDLLPPADPKTPRSRRRGVTAFCMSGRCFDLEVLFGEAEPDAGDLARANSVLATVSVAER